MKRFISYLLVVVCLLACIPLTAFAGGEETATYTLSSETVSPGSTGDVVISVTLNNNFAEGFGGALFGIIYDHDHLTLKSIERGAATTNLGGFDTFPQIAVPSLTYYNSDYSPITFKDGEVARLVFEVDTKAEGFYEIGLSIESMSGEPWFYNTSVSGSNGVTPTVIPGSITVGTEPNGGGLQGDSHFVSWSYGGIVTAGNNGDYTISAEKDGYVIDEIWVDGQLYDSDYENYHGKKSYPYTGTPKQGLVVYFAYTVDF